MHWLESTIKSHLSLSDYDLIHNKDETHKLCEKIRLSLGEMILVSELKGADIDTQQEKNWLESVVSPKEKIIALWPQERKGLALSYASFIKYHDDLWFPARDDVWLIDKADFSWLIELDHEEVFRFYTVA